MIGGYMSTEGATSPRSAGAGKYVYADLGELDEIISGWQTQGNDVRIDADLLIDAFYSLGPGSCDVVTAQYSAALGDTFDAFYQHTYEMSAYIAHHAAKLIAARQLMAIAEDNNAAMYPREGDA